MINLNPTPEPKCKHCGKDKGKHNAATKGCPYGRGSFPNFSTTTKYEPRATRVKAKK